MYKIEAFTPTVLLPDLIISTG